MTEDCNLQKHSVLADRSYTQFSQKIHAARQVTLFIVVISVTSVSTVIFVRKQNQNYELHILSAFMQQYTETIE
jgi:hypothetical protein